MDHTWYYSCCCAAALQPRVVSQLLRSSSVTRVYNSISSSSGPFGPVGLLLLAAAGTSCFAASSVNTSDSIVNTIDSSINIMNDSNTIINSNVTIGISYSTISTTNIIIMNGVTVSGVLHL